MHNAAQSIYTRMSIHQTKNPLDFSGGIFCVRNQPLIAACGAVSKVGKLKRLNL